MWLAGRFRWFLSLSVPPVSHGTGCRPTVFHRFFYSLGLGRWCRSWGWICKGVHHALQVPVSAWCARPHWAHERDSCRMVNGGVAAFTMPRQPAPVLIMAAHNEAPLKPLQSPLACPVSDARGRVVGLPIPRPCAAPGPVSNLFFTGDSEFSESIRARVFAEIRARELFIEGK